ncbi:hypothetical protein [Pedobacter nototheniae]|uniref:hypothetical protein n=1 Tax=Pedobacter nototheniae TaxID=2488994 RepID=UPI002930A4BB|nr:hypothetical protein [Pedobacter nototheniae]
MKVILTAATGLVDEDLLLICIKNPRISEVWAMVNCVNQGYPKTILEVTDIKK